MLKSGRTLFSAVPLAALLVMMFSIATGTAAIHLASAARTISLREVGHLHRVGRGSSTNLHEIGTQSGTQGGTMDVRIVTAYTTASVKFTVNPGHGTYRGQGVVSYYVAGNTAIFRGNVKITGGSGEFAHISASTMQINGTMQRKTYSATLSISGIVKT